jgi:hypothetical protein
MKYTEDVPTINGWYWRKSSDGERIMFIHNFSYPRHWKEIKADAFESVEKYAMEKLEHLKSLPDSYWIVQWAGPLVPPQSS